MFSFRHIGGLFHFRIGPLGATFYLTSTAKRNRRALAARLRSRVRHERTMARIAAHRAELEQYKQQRDQVGAAYLRLFRATC